MSKRIVLLTSVIAVCLCMPAFAAITIDGTQITFPDMSTQATAGGGGGGSAPTDHGGTGTTVNSGAGAFVGGGYNNTASGNHDVVAGGTGNTAATGTDGGGFVGGGYNNTASGPQSVVSGGYDNQAIDLVSTIGGGENNIAYTDSSTVAGGIDNRAGDPAGTGSYDGVGFAATVPGGAENYAKGAFTFAAGRAAQAVHAGAFVWADGASGVSFPDPGDPLETIFPGAQFFSVVEDEFAARATGGFRFITAHTMSGTNPTVSTPTAGAILAAGSSTFTVLSDVNSKENFARVDTHAILESLVAMPISEYNYKTQEEDIRHIGVMAQDFHAAYGLGTTEKGITTLDADGIAMAAIQGLYDVVQEKDATISELRLQLAVQAYKMTQLSRSMEQRLAAIESKVAN